MKKLSDRDKKLLYILGAIILVAASYFLVFQKLNTRTSELKADNGALRNEVSELERMVANQQNVIKSTKEYQEHIANALSEFPTEVRTQNILYEINQMYKKIENVEVQSEGYTMNQLFYQPVAPQPTATAAAGTEGEADAEASAEPTAAAPAVSIAPDPSSGTSATAITADTPANQVLSDAANYYGFRSDVAVAFTAPYSSLKRVIDYINALPDRATITDISATKQDDTDALACSMTVIMYAITGTGDYEQPDVSGIKSGKKNLFKGK